MIANQVAPTEALVAIEVGYKHIILPLSKSGPLLEALSNGIYDRDGYDRTAKYKLSEEKIQVQLVVAGDLIERAEPLQAAIDKLAERESEYWKLYSKKNEVEKQVKELQEELARIKGAITGTASEV